MNAIQHDRAGDVIPGVGLRDDVEAGKSFVRLGGRVRSSLAPQDRSDECPSHRPSENSIGANVGGPISAL